MVSHALLKTLKSVPIDFVEMFEDEGWHIISGFIKFPAKKIPSSVVRFQGASSTWSAKYFDGKKVGKSDEIIEFDCTSQSVEHIACPSKLVSNYLFFKFNDSDERLVDYTNGACTINGKHNCICIDSRNDLLAYLSEIVKYLRKKNFEEPLNSKVGFLFGKKMRIFSHNLHKVTANTFKCKCGYCVLDEGGGGVVAGDELGVVRILKQGTNNSRDLDQIPFVCDKRPIYHGDVAKSFYSNGFF